MSDITKQDPFALFMANMTNLFFSLNKKINKVMATQHEAAAQLTAAAEQLLKANRELTTKLDAQAASIASLNEKITALESAAQNSDNVSDELQAAIDAVVAGAKAQDDIVPDDVPVEQPPVEVPPVSGDGTASGDGSTATTEIPTV